MKKISILLFCFLLTAASFTAFAEETMDASITSKTAAVTISGSIAEKKTLIFVRILPEAVAADTVTPADIIANNYVYKSIRTDGNGGFGEKIILPDSYTSGIYTVYVNLGAKEFTKNITYISYSQVNQLVTALNSQTSASAFSEKFADTDIDPAKKNYELLVLSDSDYTAFGNKLAESLYNMKPQGGYTVDGLVSEYSRAYFLNKQNQSFTEDRVKEYAGYFNLDYDKEYKNLRSDEKNNFIANLAGNYSVSKASGTIFWDSLVLARISASTSYVELKNVFLTYKDYISASMTKYNSLSEYNQNNVFGQVYSQKASITSIAALKSTFEAAANGINENNNNTNNNNNNNSGSGGGGGGSLSSDETHTDNFAITDAVDTEAEAAKDAELYSDMVEHWSKNYVYQLSGRGIINGFEDGTFKPEKYITRAETIKMIAVMLNMPSENIDCFSDVASNDWYYPYVGAAYKNGIAKGTDGKFNPNESITRQDTAVLLYRAASAWLNGQGKVEFTDEKTISDYAKEPVSVLAEAGVITGYNGQFNPLGSTTRGEAAAMFSRILRIMEGVQ